MFYYNSSSDFLYGVTMYILELLDVLYIKIICLEIPPLLKVTLASTFFVRILFIPSYRV